MAEFDAKYTKTRREVKKCPPCPAPPPCSCHGSSGGSSSQTTEAPAAEIVLTVICLVCSLAFGIACAQDFGWRGFLGGAVAGLIIPALVAGAFLGVTKRS